MASIASTSRVTLGKATSKAVSLSSIMSRRQFASSSRSQEVITTKISITVANRTASFTMPTISSILKPLFPASEAHQLAVAGIPSEMVEEHDEAADVLEWDGVLNAVPKSKVSHSRKAMRAANKGLKDRVDFVHCASCGRPKLAHHICATCFSFVNRAQKASKRQALRTAEAELSQDPDVIVVTSQPEEGK